jgi:hypothetical protein
MLLTWIPGTHTSRVERIWEGRTVVCIATGPSLNSDQVSIVENSKVPVITVNDAYGMAPFADLTYFADAKWWRWHKDKPEWISFKGLKATIQTGGKSMVEDKTIHVLKNARVQGLSTEQDKICTGANSGYQAINIATLAGAKRIVLIGYDCRDEGKSHYFGEHPDKTKPPYQMIIGRFKSAAGIAENMKIEILNATPKSALECFPKVDLAASLQPHP